MSKTLIFRGGTSISKLCGSGRFSEDLDFILENGADAGTISEGVNAALKGISLQYAVESKAERYRNMLKYTLKVRGPLYIASHNLQSVQTIRLDINLFERPLMKIRQASRMPIYPDIAPYVINSLGEEELLADKIKAIMERTEPVARDLYDAWILCAKYGIKPSLHLVESKMRLYGRYENESFSLTKLKDRIRRIGEIWDREMPRLMKSAPSFAVASKSLLESLPKESGRA